MKHEKIDAESTIQVNAPATRKCGQLQAIGAGIVMAVVIAIMLPLAILYACGTKVSKN